MYYKGDGVKQDLETAYLMYDEANQLGNTTITKPMESIKQDMAASYYSNFKFTIFEIKKNRSHKNYFNFGGKHRQIRCRIYK